MNKARTKTGIAWQSLQDFISKNEQNIGEPGTLNSAAANHTPKSKCQNSDKISTLLVKTKNFPLRNNNMA